MLQVVLVKVAAGRFHHYLGLLIQWLIDVCQVLGQAIAFGIASLSTSCLRLRSPFRCGCCSTSIVAWLPDHDVVDEVLRPKLMTYRFVRPRQGAPLLLLGAESLALCWLLCWVNKRLDNWLLQSIGRGESFVIHALFELAQIILAVRDKVFIFLDSFVCQAGP